MLFFYNPTNVQADSGTCCPDTGLCIVDGEVIGRTHFFRDDGKPCDAPYDGPSDPQKDE